MRRVPIPSVSVSTRPTDIISKRSYDRHMGPQMTGSSVGRVDPKRAVEILAHQSAAVLIGVRSRVEFDYVGHPIGTVHVTWKDAPDWQTNPRFVSQVKQALLNRGWPAPDDTPVLLICRSGGRSLAAGEILSASGFKEVYNVEQGFEGDRDAGNHRGTMNGRRCLPKR